MLDRAQSQDYTDLLTRILPKKTFQYGTFELAFHRSERYIACASRPSNRVCRKLLQYYFEIDPDKPLAPCASIVGSSGIGKSSSIQQLAVHHEIYVVYANLGQEHGNAYPHRSEIATKLPIASEPTLRGFWGVLHHNWSGRCWSLQSSWNYARRVLLSADKEAISWLSGVCRESHRPFHAL